MVAWTMKQKQKQPNAHEDAFLVILSKQIEYRMNRRKGLIYDIYSKSEIRIMHKASHLFRLTHKTKSLSSWCHGTVRYSLLICIGTVRLKLCQQSMTRWPLCKKTSGPHEIQQTFGAQGLPTVSSKKNPLLNEFFSNNLSVTSVLIRSAHKKVQKTHSSSLRQSFVC